MRDTPSSLEEPVLPQAETAEGEGLKGFPQKQGVGQLDCLHCVAGEPSPANPRPPEPARLT